MTDSDFPEEVRWFIRDAIPTLDAAELLVLLATHSEQKYRVNEIIEAIRPTVMFEADVVRYLMHFQSRGLLTTGEDEAYQYRPLAPELDAVVRALTRAFNERPVTLIRLIYAPKDEKIRSFADAFRFKK